MTPALRQQTFRCPYLHSTISRGACAGRHNLYASKGCPSADSVTACACRSCPIGQQHARGKAADVALVRVEPRIEPVRKTARLCVVCAKPVSGGSPSGRGRRRFICDDPTCRDFAEFEHQDDPLMGDWA